MHVRLQFTIKIETKGRLHFPDMTFIKTDKGYIITDLFFKYTEKNSCLNFKWIFYDSWIAGILQKRYLNSMFLLDMHFSALMLNRFSPTINMTL